MRKQFIRQIWGLAVLGMSVFVLCACGAAGDDVAQTAKLPDRPPVATITVDGKETELAIGSYDWQGDSVRAKIKPPSIKVVPSQKLTVTLGFKAKTVCVSFDGGKPATYHEKRRFTIRVPDRGLNLYGMSIEASTSSCGKPDTVRYFANLVVPEHPEPMSGFAEEITVKDLLRKRSEYDGMPVSVRGFFGREREDVVLYAHLSDYQNRSKVDANRIDAVWFKTDKQLPPNGSVVLVDGTFDASSREIKNVRKVSTAMDMCDPGPCG